jgi:spermidine synthase
VQQWEEVASAAIPGGRETMRLVRDGEELKILVGRAELMTNVSRGSERALGTLGCAHLRDRPGARVLIGGLGMGFTLRAALEILHPDATIVVSEIVPEVAQWARGPLAPLFDDCLDDPRVEVRIEDVHRTIQAGPASYDAIILDVDNGPVALTQHGNHRLYDPWGLKRARFALRPGGVLAVWSGAPDRRFKARLRLCGFEVVERRVHAEGKQSRRHIIWLATRPGGDAW